MLDKDQVRQMVRRVVYRTLGMPQISRPAATRPLVTEADVHAAPVGGQFTVPPGALITPLARQVALDRHLTLVETGAAAAQPVLGADAVEPSRVDGEGIADRAGRNDLAQLGITCIKVQHMPHEKWPVCGD